MKLKTSNIIKFGKINLKNGSVITYISLYHSHMDKFY